MKKSIKEAIITIITIMFTGIAFTGIAAESVQAVTLNNSPAAGSATGSATGSAAAGSAAPLKISRKEFVISMTYKAERLKELRSELKERLVYAAVDFESMEATAKWLFEKYSEVSDLICNTSEYKYGKQQIKVVNAWNKGIEQELLGWNSLYMYFACSCSYNSDLEYAQEYLSLSNDLFHTYQNKLDKYCVKYKL